MNKISTHPIVMNCLLTLVLLITLSTPSFAAPPDDTLPFRHHKFQLDPISLLVGTVVANYECRVTPVHAFALEGFYTFPGLAIRQGGGIQYRHYYTPRHFWGIFGNNGELAMKIPSMERGDTTTYTINISYLTLGANWGKNWLLKTRFPVIFRFGLGYPVICNLSWKNGIKPPQYVSLYEGIYRFTVAMDSELTIGVNF